MLPDTLRDKRIQILELAHLHGAEDVRVFGSVARGEECAVSDIDLLVTLPSGYDMFLQRLPLSDSLSTLLNRKIDLVPEHELNKHLRDKILTEAVRLLARAGTSMLSIFWMLLKKSEECGSIESNDILCDATLRNLQTLSEATQHLPQKLKSHYADIPWKSISGFRNFLVHNYLGGIDPATLMNVVNVQLQPLPSERIP